jgi:hypothetical protein
VPSAKEDTLELVEGAVLGEGAFSCVAVVTGKCLPMSSSHVTRLQQMPAACIVHIALCLMLCAASAIRLHAWAHHRCTTTTVVLAWPAHTVPACILFDSVPRQ